jgi:hypothetical protein
MRDCWNCRDCCDPAMNSWTACREMEEWTKGRGNRGV